MKNKYLILLMLSISAYAWAQQESLTWVAMFNMGPVWASNGETQTITLGSELEKTYASDDSANPVFEGEVFLGLQQRFSHVVLGQLGLTVGATGNDHLTGDIWDDADPQFNNYEYDYDIQHTYVLVKGLLSFDTHSKWIPWISAGVGVGFNHAHSFNNTPTDPDAVASPNFASNTQTSFTYAIGLGVKHALNEHWLVGLGYEFADWGKSSLDPASGQTTNAALLLDHLYTNAVLFNLTYIGGHP